MKTQKKNCRTTNNSNNNLKKSLLHYSINRKLSQISDEFEAIKDVCRR